MSLILPACLAGYHKVSEENTVSLWHVTLYNGTDDITVCVRDTEYDADDMGLTAHVLAEYPGINLPALYAAPIETEWAMRWHVWKGTPMTGLHATVVKGRRKGGVGIVERIYPIHDKYRRTVAEYVRLSDGTRTNVNNCTYAMPDPDNA